MVAVEKKLGFRERSEREIAFDMWTALVQRRRPELAQEDLEVIVDKVVDVVMNGKADFETSRQKIAAILEQ